MAEYILAGLVSGSIYALAALGVVSTYVSSGVLNFAYGSFAFFVARFYYYLNTQHGWAIVPSALVAILVFSPLAGFVLWATILRNLNSRPTLIKVGATIGISVALPALAQVLFGNALISSVPGLAPQPVAVYRVLGLSITLDQVIVLGSLVAVLVLGGLLLRFTTAGVIVRAVVDSEEMSTLVGINPQRVSAVVWAVSFTLAGLAGVLVAPTLGLESSNFTFLLGTAFASVIVAKLRYPGRAVLTALALGVVTSLIQKYVPANSALAQELIPAVPFAFVLAFIAFGSRDVADQRLAADTQLGAQLARADELGDGARSGRDRLRLPAAAERVGRPARSLIPIALVIIALLVLSSYWIGVIGQGIAYGVAFLSFTLLTGEGGFISLAQITFAAFGAVAVGQFNSQWHFTPLEALVVATVVSLAAGLLVGFVTVRLGSLYVALITLTLGLLMDNLVYALPHFTNNGGGVPVGLPGFATGGRGFALFGLVCFVLCALFVWRVRNSTAGLAISAARWSPTATSMLGLSTTAVRALLVGAGAAIAGLGGGLLAMLSHVSLPSEYVTALGLVWLAVVIAVGIRSIWGALAAGLAFAVVPALFQSYLPASWGAIPTMLFGLAAIGMVRQPDGIVADLALLRTKLRQLSAPSNSGAKSAPVPE